MTGKEIPLLPKGKAKLPLGYVKVASVEKGERKKGIKERGNKGAKGRVRTAKLQQRRELGRRRRGQW